MFKTIFAAPILLGEGKAFAVLAEGGIVVTSPSGEEQFVPVADLVRAAPFPSGQMLSKLIEDWAYTAQAKKDPRPKPADRVRGLGVENDLEWPFGPSARERERGALLAGAAKEVDAAKAAAAAASPWGEVSDDRHGDGRAGLRLMN